jgi:hypothetical protein
VTGIICAVKVRKEQESMDVMMLSVNVDI